MTVQMRQGSRYRDKAGRVHGPMWKDPDWNPWPYEPRGSDGSDAWDAEGHHFAYPDRDLVAWVPST